MSQSHPTIPYAQANRFGTLLWVGDRDSHEFRDIFQYCESFAPQVAHRSDIADCLNRPAAEVTGIVMTRQTRQDFDECYLTTIRELYGDATMIQVLGSLCAGERPRQTGPFANKTIYWHQWNQYLPNWLSDCGVQTTLKPQPAFSVAVVASNHSSAQPLMDLAEASGAATLWCQRPQHDLVRNVDAVWWDESAARPTTASYWNDRIRSFESAASASHRQRKCRHVWLASWPRREHIRSAIAGGVELVISKPYEVSLLCETLGQNHQDHTSKQDTATELPNRRVA